jgi:pyridoxamine 5'-phosphate oxidase
MTDTPAIEHPDLLRNGDFTEASEPLVLFAAWMEEAKRSEPNDPNAMALATAGADGFPDVRMVLLKGFDEAGFVFFTNLESAKARELRERPQAALVFHWKSLRRQVRVRGQVTPVSEAEADAYFATRPRLAQIGAWASRQSSPLESRLAFEGAVARVTARYPLGTIPRPPFWSGFRIAPVAIEFWHDRPFRLHDRIAFTRGEPREPWTKTRLYP